MFPESHNTERDCFLKERVIKPFEVRIEDLFQPIVEMLLEEVALVEVARQSRRVDQLVLPNGNPCRLIDSEPGVSGLLEKSRSVVRLSSALEVASEILEKGQ